ncbi:MAG: hypothetical protein ACOXZ6_04490 [Syntrophomonadaceae bacterium]
MAYEVLWGLSYHTRRSDGRQSEEQIIVAALGRGLKEVAITDHGIPAVVMGGRVRNRS